jgi:hypothetical protein
MPARSKAQQRAAGAALAAKRGEIEPSELWGASRQMFQSMTEAELDELASTKLEGKPEHVGGGADKGAKPARRRASAKRR